MGEYRLLCTVLFTLIIGSQTWPQNGREEKGTMRTASDASDMGDDGIRFPDDDMPLSRRDFSAEGKGRNCTLDVCEKAEDYPFEYIESIVSKLHGLAELNGEFVGNIVNSTIRINPDNPDQDFLCATTVYTAFPQTIKNDHNVTKYIVNDDKYKQGVIYETCVGDSKCNKIASFPGGIEATCVQKYSKVRLLAIDNDTKDNAKAAYDTFIVPSCCVCSFKKPKVNH